MTCSSLVVGKEIKLYTLPVLGGEEDHLIRLVILYL